MNSAQPFVVPANVTFQIEDDGVTIENEGDIVLHTNFGRMLKRIVSTHGSVHLHIPVQAGYLYAGQHLHIDGAATVGTIEAGGEVLVQGELQGNSITAATLVSSGKITADKLAVVMLESESLHANTVQATGDVVVKGGAQVQELRAGGQVSCGEATLGLLSATGSASIQGACNVNQAQVGGSLSIGGALQAGTIYADSVSLHGASSAARGIQAKGALQLGAGKIHIDAVVADALLVDPHSTGRITLLAVAQEPGPNALKGCFDMTDYQEMLGDPRPFLQERGLDPDTAPTPPSSPAAPIIPALSPPKVVVAPMVISTPPVNHVPKEVAPVEAQPVEAAPEEPVEPQPVEVQPVEAQPVEAQPVEAQPVEAQPVEPVLVEPTPVESDPFRSGENLSAVFMEAPPLAVSVVEPDPVEIEPVAVETEPAVVEEPPAPVLHPLHSQLLDTVNKVAEAYSDTELPPAVEKLKGLVEEQSYDRIRAEITQIWSDLLRFHQRKGIRLPHQVTPTFNIINSLVKKM